MNKEFEKWMKEFYEENEWDEGWTRDNMRDAFEAGKFSIPLDKPVKPANDVRYLPKQEPRVGTGTIQFGDDWQGLFIRGDNCFAYTFDLQLIIEDSTLDISPLAKIRLQSLLDLLKGTKENRLSV